MTIRSTLIVSVFLLAATLVQAQVGIGTNSPHTSAQLEVRSNNKGVLLPSISLTGTNDVSTISSPAAGLLIYNSNTVIGANAVTPGFYYFNGTAWMRLIVPADNAANVTGTIAVANGGTGATSAAGAIANLGASTIGNNLFTLTNPGAVSFPQFNANNTVSALSASDFRAAIGAGTSSTSGTVTSVGLSLPSILSVSGSPVTSSGTLSASLANQNANLVFAGPASGSAAAPTFRTLVAADIPTLNQNTTGTASNVTGTVAVANGGTGTTTGSITGTGALTFTAGGTNQGITLAPSGTGNIILNNNVGIGTTSPSAALHVASSVSQYVGSYGYLNVWGASTYVSNGNQSYSIQADQRIRAPEFNAISDARIKKDILKLNPASQLADLNKLKVVSYSYIDQLINGVKSKTGFIAQEVEAINPKFVSLSTDFIPSVFTLAKSTILVNDMLQVTTDKPHDFKKGDIVKFFVGGKKEVTSSIENVDDPNSFSVKGWNDTVDNLFIYGKKVTDFRAIDFDQITALSVAAIQELSKQIEILKSENAELKKGLVSPKEFEKLKIEVDILKKKLSIL